MKHKKYNERRLNLPVLIAGVIITALLTFWMGTTQKQKDESRAEAVAWNKLNRIEMNLKDYIYLTETLGMVIEVNGGMIDNFDTMAETMQKNKPALRSIQLAPNGVVAYSYPMQGNEAGLINLFEDPKRREEALEAKETGETIVAGPYELLQGGIGMVARKPIYLSEEKSQDSFWGFGIVVLMVDDMIKESNVESLSAQGYRYCLSYQDSDGNFQVLDRKGTIRSESICVESKIYGKKWRIELSPEIGWRRKRSLMLFFLFGLTLAGMFSRSLELAKQLEKDAITDQLTGIYNRRGGEQTMQSILKGKDVEKGILMVLDIDNFKHLNDLYGHAMGDAVLEQFVADAKKCFGKQAVYIRNGGDEFNIFVKENSLPSVQTAMKTFTNQTHIVTGEGEEVTFMVSCGYVKYPEQGTEYADLCKKADLALYSVKLNGKHNCGGYQEDMQVRVRSQLGFSLGDIADKMPGGMLIYCADETEKILFANKWLVNMFGCKSLDELIRHTGGTFRGIVCQEDYEKIEHEIWSQIDEQEEKHLDYVEYRIKRKDGTLVNVLDYGHLVDLPKYGKVFFVIINQLYSNGRNHNK